METEKAMQISLLLGRFASTLRDQLAIVSDLSENFETGWDCALQEESLRLAMLAINSFLREEEEDLLGPVFFDGRSLWEWQEVLQERLRSTEIVCRKLRKDALTGTARAEDLFPELEAGI